MKSVVYLGCPAADRAETQKALGAAELSVVWADNVASALGELQRRDMPVLLDLSLGAAALQHARDLRNKRASTLMFAVVDAQQPELAAEAVLAGVADVFARPLRGRRVAGAIAREHAYESGADDDRRVEPNGDNLYSHSSAMRDVLTLIARAAATRAGVMIRGEDGTGRQIVARCIHTQSRSTAPFLPIDCAAFEAEQLDEALFGVPARSSQPDTAGRGLEPISRKSALYGANGGTLYVQHVGEAPTRVQGRLARMLRDREAVLSDTGDTMTIDIRPIASVDPDIEVMVREGRVREDLFRRLSALRIDMPALKNRREDLPALANYFVREICARRRVPPKTLTRSALSLIGALPWRGNANELRALLDLAVASVSGPRAIGLEDILAHVRLDGRSAVAVGGGTLRQARFQFEREYIASVLERHGGRISEAARTLGMQRTNLYRKMRSLSVTRARRPKSF